MTPSACWLADGRRRHVVGVYRRVGPAPGALPPNAGSERHTGDAPQPPRGNRGRSDACQPGDSQGRTYNQMVVALLSTTETDKAFHALADATRRDIVRTVLVQAHSVSALARRYPMSFAAVQKHVAVLEEAGLVSKQRRGRESLVRGDIDRVRDARGALDALEVLWRDRVAQMDEILAEDR